MSPGVFTGRIEHELLHPETLSLATVQVLLSDLSSKVKSMPRPDRSRAALVDTAALLFRRQGYAATGVNQILQSADVKAGSHCPHSPSGRQAPSADTARRLVGQV